MFWLKPKNARFRSKIPKLFSDFIWVLPDFSSFYHPCSDESVLYAGFDTEAPESVAPNRNCEDLKFAIQKT